MNGSGTRRMRNTKIASEANPAASPIQRPLVRNSRRPVVPMPSSSPPSPSKEPWLGASLGSSVWKKGTSSSTAAVTANSQCQPRYSTMAPPATGPRPRPSETADIMVAMALPRRSKGT
ncbi:hypothetical protein D3C71_1340160 [compost metagenome]